MKGNSRREPWLREPVARCEPVQALAESTPEADCEEQFRWHRYSC